MIEVQLVDGRIIEFPDGTSQDVIRETAKKATNNKYFGVSTEELRKQPTAPFSVGDTAKAGLASLVGSVGSIASAFGADNAPAKYLQESASGIQQTLSPERQEEMRRRVELEERASKQGIGQEIMTGLGGVAEAPIQSTVSGIASSVPAIIAGAAALSVGAPVAIAGTVALVAKLAVGALQGAGEAKGNIYETVRDKLMAEKGLSREEAEAQASKAQEYISANAPAIMGSTAAGMLDAVTGVESILGKKVAGKAATRPLTAPSLTGAVARGAGTEALPEAIQGGVGKYGENVALQNAGFDVSSFSGVAGAAARDALMGALTGAAVSPLQMSQLRKEHEEEKQRRVNEETAKIDEQIAKEQEAIQQQQVAKEQEILSTPVERVPEPENLHPIRNPLGNISQEELKAEGVDPYLLEHINEYRKTSNLPPLKSYAVEDIVDAMPGVNPVEEQKQIDTILNSRTGYQGEPISAKDVLDQAAAREIPTDNKSFTDFLNRTTGEADIKSMSNSQLFAAFKAIQNVPQGQELEEGTSSTRFTPEQYKEAVKSLDKDLETAALTVDQVLSNIKETTGLKEDLHASSILNEAVRRGDVDREGDKVSAPTTAEKLPEGYTIQEGTFKQGEKPEGYEVVLGEDALPQIHATEEVAQKKAEEVTKVRGQLFKQMTNQIAQQEKALEKSQDALTAMQANGQQDTVPYQKAWAKHQKLEKATNENIQKLNAQLEKINPETVPVSVRKAAARVSKKRGHTVFKGQQAISTHKTRQEAEVDLLEGLTDDELASAAQAKGRRTLAAKAKAEMERRAAPPPVKEVEPGKEFEDKFKPLLEKFGLNDVALKFTKDMKSEGEYSKSVIKIALDSANPVRVLRHESVHALKELGFFTPQQWKALEGAAKREWINTYLKGRNINGEPLEAGQQSRYDAYMNVYKGDMDAIIEEAIADAFADFDLNKAPPGLMSAILKRLKLFFEALQNSLTGAGFQTYEDVFGKVEKGELKATEKPTEAGVKLSLGNVPLSTRGIMEMEDTQARAALGLKTVAVKNRFNNVREIANALNEDTLRTDGEMDRLNLTDKDQKRIATAMADEVEYQLGTKTQTGTGLGWYSNNYPKAVKKLGERFPELKTDKHARSVFSAIVAVTSNGERVATNIKNAIDLYSKLRDGKKLVGVGSRRATALDNNLQVIQDLLNEHGRNFEKVLLKEITVKDMNAALRELGEDTDGSYLADTVVPAAAVYFGPKLGAFYANLSGSEGYLTMDLWWTRSVNRMRGLLMTEATEASIDKFRNMMGRPDATKDEVVAATIPLRNKYEEYEWTTELEYLAKEKEPSKKDEKAKWFKRAQKNAGEAYEQLLFEHKLEKMANTIYKNEYENLEEAPFTATDRKFMYDAARDAQGMLRKKGIDLTLADIQAALWYYEKRLYQKLSGRKADDIGYEEAILAQADKAGGRARPSVVFPEQPSGRAEPTGEVEEAPRVREPSGEPTKKLSLREAPNLNMSDLPPPSDGEFVLKEGTRIYHGAHKTRAEEINAGGKKLLARPPYKSGGGMMDEGNLIWFGGEDLATGHSKSEIDTLRAKYDEEKGLLRMEGDVFSALTDKDYSLVNRGKSLTQKEANTLNNSLQLPDYKKVKAGDSLWQAARRAHDVSPVVDSWQVADSGRMTDSLAKSLTALGYDGLYDGSGIALVAKEGIDIGQTPMKRYSLRETPEFKQWFGDSKVVDEDGNPLPVYHMSKEKGVTQFSPQFKTELSSMGFHFGTKEQAEFRSTQYDFRGTPTLGEYYLSIQNPLSVSHMASFAPDHLAEQMMDMELITPDQYEDIQTDNSYSDKDIGADLVKVLKKAGYDGLVYENEREGEGNSYVPFNENQIKLTSTEKPTKSKDVRYSLRDTPQFKEWFGDSRIVNSDGTPKVMYHGTARDISEFKPKQANAIFLTDDPKFAESFSLNSENFMAQKVLDSLSLEERQQITKQAEKIAKKKGTFAGDEVRGVLMERLPSRSNIIPVYVSAQNPFEFDSAVDIRRLKSVAAFDAETIAGIQLGDWNTIESSDVQDAIKEAGFDSFYVKEGGRKNLAVYKPEQIKSATGNVGTFDKYNPDIRYNLRNTIPADIMAEIDRATTAREEKGFVERMMEAISPKSFSEFRAQALNRYNRLGEYDKKLAEKMGGAALYADVSAESAALFSDLGAGLTASALGVHDRNGGIPVYKNGVTTVTNLNGTVKGPVAIFAPLAKYGDPTIYQTYQWWAGSLRGKRLLADGKEHVYTQADMSKAARLLQQFPEFAQIQKEWIQYNNGLVKFLVDTGVLSKEKADEFTRYSDYIPFYRQMDGENTIGPNIFQAISGVKAPKKLKGSEAPLADFLETVVRNTQSSIQMGIKNVASQRAANVATKINMAQRLNHVASGPDVFVVMENGKQVYYRSADYLFINAIKSLNLPDLPFIGLLAAPANLLRNLVTKDPGFMLANMVRDSMAAYLTSGAKMTPIASTISNFGKAIAGTSPEFNALLNAGLLGGYEFSSNVEQSGRTMQEALRIKAGMKTKMDRVRGVWQALEKGTTASDAATRMEVYKSTMAETGNEAEALFRAMEVMNFNRKGSSAVVRLLTAAVPFLNARMQGLDVLYRTAFGKNATANAKQMQRAFFVRGMTMFGMSCMYWALTHDDDDYKNQEQETKDNYWLIPALGIKIPTPFEVAIPFKVIPERIMALTFGTDTAKDFTDSMTRQLTSTLMFNPIPQTALPFVEVVTNHSFFTGRDIIGQGMQDIAPEFQVGPGTSLLSQKIGSAVGMSPMKLDHLIKGFTGTIGMYGVDIIDSVLDLNSNSPKVSKRFEQLPVIKRFALDPEARGAVTAYYDLKNSVDETTRTINLLERTGNFDAWGEYYKDNMNLLATKDYVSDLEKDMKEIREMKVMIRSSTISGDDKRDALVSLNRMENQLVSNIKEIRKFALK
jgi:hypothetical protein